MPSSTRGTGGTTVKAGQAARVVEFLRTSRLVNLDQPVSQFVGAIGSIADDIDGHLICWQAYVLIHRPFGKDIADREIGG
jgi:hypothetical protein